jgi:hypothetical protein
MSSRKRIVICGGGMIGAAIAYFTSRRAARRGFFCTVRPFCRRNFPGRWAKRLKKSFVWKNPDLPFVARRTVCRMRPHHPRIWNLPMPLDPAAAGSFFYAFVCGVGMFL